MKKTNLKEIAKIANVSVATVSYALNDQPQVSEITRAKIKKIAEELEYVPNLSAQNLKTSHSNLICAVLNTYQGNFNGDVLQEVQLLFSQIGYRLLAVSGSIPDIVKTNIIDGVLMLNYTSTATELTSFAKSLNQKPVVFLTNEINSPNASSVVIDNQLGIKYLMDMFRDSPHQKICFLTGNVQSYNNQERLAAAQKYYQHYYKKTDFDQHQYNGDFNSGVAYEIGKELLTTHDYDAFLCFNDDMALGIYHAASDLGIHVGEEISIAGFDDSYVASVVSPGLTTVHVDKKEWAQQVITQYTAIKQGDSREQVIKLAPQLTIRKSVKLSE